MNEPLGATWCGRCQSSGHTRCPDTQDDWEDCWLCKRPLMVDASVTLTTYEGKVLHGRVESRGPHTGTYVVKTPGQTWIAHRANLRPDFVADAKKKNEEDTVWDDL